MSWEFMNKAPPWLVLIIVLGMGSGGGAGFVSWMQPNVAIKATLEKLNTTMQGIADKLEKLDRKQENFEWRMSAHDRRISGAAVKDQQQDDKIDKIDRSVTRLEAINGR